MLSHAQFMHVSQLLAKQYRLRSVARITGIDRKTVRLIASGKMPEPPPPRPDDDTLLDGPRGRCPDCGAMVVLPCRLCRTQQFIAAGGVEPDRSERAELPALRLRGQHQARFEEVLAQRRAAEATEGRIRKQAKALKVRRRWYGF